MKKKSAAIPTRSTKALYSNKSEYERKRNSRALMGGINPTSSAVNIDTRYSGRFPTTKLDTSQKSKPTKKNPGLKYPNAEISNSSYNPKEKYTVLKNSREHGRLIEFKLHDEDLSDNNKLENSKNLSKNLKTKLYQPKLSENKTGVLKRLYGTKSDPQMEILKNKYWKSSLGTNFKKKHPSISIEKSLHNNKSSKYEYQNKSRCKTSRNTALASYKEVKSNKNNFGSENQVKKGSALSIKTTTCKPSQVKIYLKKDY